MANTLHATDFVSVLGVRIRNLSKVEAIALLEELITDRRDTAHSLFIVNAHTLNLATESADYHRILNSAYAVLGDGTGVRWAARLRGMRLKDNLVGTDLIPELFRATAGRGFRYFLLGADADSVQRAAQSCCRTFDGWELAGFHHGYFNQEEATNVINFINSTRPDLLLVAMGNPRQESWIHVHQSQLQVPVCVGVGGLFDHWAGNLSRAPLWVRQRGLEWLQILLQQPHKWDRYLIGNPKFLYRIVRRLPSERLPTGA